MSTTKHTPGPWRAVVNADHGKVEKIVGRDGHAVAFPCWGNGQGQRPAEVVNADAHLIEVAPVILNELREAEKDFVALASSVRREIRAGRKQWDGVPEIIDNRVKAIRAAMRRATMHRATGEGA